MLRRTLHICWWTVAAAVVAMAVLLSAARLMLPGMSDYREQIEAVAAGVFGRPVSIGSLDAVWRGLSPVLEFRDVVVDDPRLPGGRLAIDSVEVAVDVVASLVQRRLLTAGVRVIGTRLSIETDVRAGAKSLPVQAIVSWLLSQDSVTLEDVQLQWRDTGLFDAPLRLGDLSAKLVNAGQRHQFLVETQLPMSQGERIKVAADLYGPREDPGAWRGTLYLHGKDTQLATFAPAMADTGLRAGGAVNLELWLGLAGGRAVWGSGSLAWQKLAVNNRSADAQGVSANSLSTGFYWRQRGERWRVSVRDFLLQRGGEAVWPDSRFDLVVSADERLRIRGQASLLVLQELTGILPLLPWTDNNALAMLDRLQPGGLLREADFSFAYQAGQAPQFAVRSAIENLTLAASGGSPGVTGVSGHVEGNLQAGHLQLRTSDAALVLPDIFTTPLALTRLGGEVRWQRFKDRFRIETSRLQVASGPMSLESRWQMDWLYDQPAPWLDLQLAADSLPLSAVGEYLPAGVMSAAAVRWVQRAFVDGQASDVRLLLQGRVDEMPFDTGNGRFEARFEVADATLDYRRGWPQLHDISGRGVFSGRSMRVVVDSARVRDTHVTRAVATLEDMQEPVLETDGTFDSTLAAMLDFVNNSPLQAQFGALIEATETTGDASLQLRLGIPLKRSLGRMRVQGSLQLDGNDLLPRESELGLTDIRGKLYFTRYDVSLKRAKARVFGRPVALSVYKQGKGDDATTVVSVQGRLKLVELAKEKFPALAGWLQGDTGWQAFLQIRDRDSADTPRVSMEVHSGLQGVSVSLPGPFAKPAAQTRSLSARWVPGSETRQPIHISYGENVNMSLLLTRDRRPRKAALHFGGAMPALPGDDGLRLSGHLDELDLGQWLTVLAPFDRTRRDEFTTAVELSAGRFKVGGVDVEDIEVLSDAGDPLYFRVSGEGAAGWVRWIPGAHVLPSQLLARLDHLYLYSSRRERDKPLADDLKPQAMPRLNVTVEDLQWGEREFGKVSVISQRTRDGVHFESLELESPAVTLSGNGDWRVRNGVEGSRFHAAVSQGDLEALSSLLGSGNSIKGGSLEGDIQLSWPGSPLDFSLSGMEGEFDLKSRNGRLEDVEEGAGKLISLFSLNSLQRRLSLDFSDVAKEGLSYDVMKGHFVVMDGDAFTNDFTLEAPSVNIEVSGRTGLVAHDYDQLVTVTPQVTSTLPIAGAIAGGPLVGAAAFVADKLLGDSFNRLTQVQYQVSGSWDDPVYTKLKKQRKQRSPADIDEEY